ncbi:hypothetical protein BJY00DRAFT_211360 [Aspergillus carlsbadensis]|nr:hypothetical protein BJY00DRAFT_211360 [Aspergillus carlsbadensis]
MSSSARPPNTTPRSSHCLISFHFWSDPSNFLPYPLQLRPLPWPCLFHSSLCLSCPFLLISLVYLSPTYAGVFVTVTAFVA